MNAPPPLVHRSGPVAASGAGGQNTTERGEAIKNMPNPRIGRLLGDTVFLRAQREGLDSVGQGNANPEPIVRAFDMALSLAGTASADAA
jgi:hypothetical protein